MGRRLSRDLTWGGTGRGAVQHGEGCRAWAEPEHVPGCLCFLCFSVFFSCAWAVLFSPKGTSPALPPATSSSQPSPPSARPASAGARATSSTQTRKTFSKMLSSSSSSTASSTAQRGPSGAPARPILLSSATPTPAQPPPPPPTTAMTASAMPTKAPWRWAPTTPLPS